MDYKAKYEELRSKIQNLHDRLTGELRQVIEEEVPETIESEDERILAFIDSMQEESVCAYSTERYTDEDRKVLCEGCEEECKFNKKEPASEDLEEALEKYIESIIPETELNSTTPFALEYVIELLQKAYKDGANWQKEQLMKEAVVGEICEDSCGCLYAHIPMSCLNGFSRLDKIKALIIK